MTRWFTTNIVLVEGTLVLFLLALSIHFPLRMGVFSFAGLAAYAVGAYTTAIITLELAWSPLLAISAGVVLATAGSCLLAMVVRGLSGLYLAMATVAVNLGVQVVVLNGGELTGGAMGLYGVVTDIGFLHVLLFAVVAAASLALTEVGQLARRIDAVREDELLASSMGIQVGRYRFMSFVVSAILGAAAGGMEVLLKTTFNPRNIGFATLIAAVTVVIMGGFTSWIGAAIGAVIVTWLPIMLQEMQRYQHLVYGIAVVLAAIFFQSGIYGVLHKIYRRAVRARHPTPDRGAVARFRDNTVVSRAEGVD